MELTGFPIHMVIFIVISASINQNDYKLGNQSMIQYNFSNAYFQLNNRANCISVFQSLSISFITSQFFLRKGRK